MRNINHKQVNLRSQSGIELIGQLGAHAVQVGSTDETIAIPTKASRAANAPKEAHTELLSPGELD